MSDYVGPSRSTPCEDDCDLNAPHGDNTEEEMDVADDHSDS